MPQNRSMKKGLRQQIKRTERNKAYRTRMRSAMKVAKEAADAGTDDAGAKLIAAQSAIDRAARAGAIHHRNAARTMSRLTKSIA